jgi:Superfamily II DNA/RNA helicases, SNF2 family
LRSDIDKLQEYTWTYCVLDEGSFYSRTPKLSPQKQQGDCAVTISLFKWNSSAEYVNELWSIFDWLMPNYLGSNSEFSQNYAKIITKGNLPTASSVEIRQGMEKLKQLHQQVLPFILRREKRDVLKELPPKIITDIPCAMTDFQSRLYDDYSDRKEIKRALDILEEIVTKNESFQNDGSVNNKLEQNFLQSLLSLRFICTHPMLLSKSKNAVLNYSIPTRFDVSGKLLALNDLLRRARIVQDEDTAADNDCSLLYVEEENFETSSADAFIKDIGNDSGILEDGYTDTDDNHSNNHAKCLIFAQFSQSLDIVEEVLFKRVMPSLRYVRLDGKTAPSDRSKIIEAFQTDDSIRCMLLTTKVGSLGLNLQAADTVIFLESDWNPFVDLQAMDRSHRIGQKNMVKVYRLITEDSIEEKIMAIQKAKIAMSEAIVNTENSTLYSMGTDRLLDLFSTSH